MLTVLLATRNRAAVLRNTLESFCRLQSPASGWKLIVVDNGSTDNTAGVLESFAGRLPLLAVAERRLGKNVSLNTGLALVEGDLTILTDDDVFPRPDWLVQMQRAADAQPQYSIFGGTIVPHWGAPPPGWVWWLELSPIYTVTDPGLEEGPISPLFIFGPNMAIRSAIFQSGGRFDGTIGPRGANYAMGSETEFVLRLEQQGHKAWFVRGAVVGHLVGAEHLTTAWVMRRAVRFGRGQYRLFYKELLAGAKVWRNQPIYIYREIVQEGLAAAWAWVTFKRQSHFVARWRFNYRRGQAIAARLVARELRAEAEASSPA